MVEIIKILDDMTSKRRQSRADGGTSSKETLETYEDDDGTGGSRIISTETILRASALAQEDVDEQIKAKFLARLVKEYRKNRERAKQESLRE